MVAPLDWGLGHATRSVPIIRELLLRGHNVVVASSGSALALLKDEFPNLTFFELPSYRPRYSSRIPLIAKVILQLPKFMWTIWREHRAIDGIVSTHKIDCVISDNRFGCWTKQVPTVFITHQLNIQMPAVLGWLEGFVNILNHRRIRKFNECWIIDFPENRLTGKLTEPGKLPVTFIGMLSRFNKVDMQVNTTYDYLALISGPEPQRTFFEQKVRACFSQLEGKKMLIRGLPGEGEETTNTIHFDEVNHLKAKDLERVITQSKLVICRSGYSSIMDLAVLQKKALFIPTPGQTEQEYLSKQLLKRGVALSVSQTAFTSADIPRALAFPGFLDNFSGDLLKRQLDKFGC